jgi:hypothetical protein
MMWNPIVCFSLQMKSNPIGVFCTSNDVKSNWVFHTSNDVKPNWMFLTSNEVKSNSVFRTSNDIKSNLDVSHFKWSQIQFGVLCMCATCCWHSLVQGVRLLNPQRFITTWVLFLQSNYQRNDHQNPQLPCALTHTLSLSLHVCMSFNF